MMEELEHGSDSTDLSCPEVADAVTENAALENWNSAFGEVEEQTDARKAADYARSLGFEKAGDYIARHYDGGEFSPEEPIPVTTRNMKLEGTVSENGIPFERRTAKLTEGLSVEGVFPVFDSRHHVELGEKANDMTLYQQFSACRQDFQDHMFDSPEKLEGLTLGDMERMDNPQGFAPEGWTWQHNPETGSFDLVSSADHAAGHTGGNAFWGIYDCNEEQKNSDSFQVNSPPSSGQ